MEQRDWEYNISDFRYQVLSGSTRKWAEWLSNRYQVLIWLDQITEEWLISSFQVDKAQPETEGMA